MMMTSDAAATAIERREEEEKNKTIREMRIEFQPWQDIRRHKNKWHGVRRSASYSLTSSADQPGFQQSPRI